MDRSKEFSKGDVWPTKRKADEAFPTTRHNPKSRIVKGSGLNKTVNFEDGDRHVHGFDRMAHNNGIKQSNTGRLQQRAQALSGARTALPIYSHAHEIRTKLKSNDVLLLVGETGSGKSTQIPQFLLNEPYVKPTQSRNDAGKVGGRIAIAQPRRVAAISLARRVAEEMGSPLGNASPASQVGYSVRFDTSVSPATKIKFLTDGMLLQELLRDPWLKEYSVVVVDEVHERGLNVDLVLGFLKRIIEAPSENDGRGGMPLKVVVMSATADMEKIEQFFGRPSKPMNGSLGTDTDTNGTNGKHEENEETFEGFSDDDGHETRIVSCFIKGRQFPVKIEYTSQPVESAIDAALARIVQIHQHMPLPGDVLVFLPGQETIDSLETLCNNYASSLEEQSKQKGSQKIPKLLTLPLFAALPTAAQQRVFEPTPPFTRKIILSTNIAETSVTVPGVRHVIDTGKRKARFFRPSLNLDTLLIKPISRSSAKQRAGRAGREAAGSCWRLYTEKTFYELEADTEPEILRCDLSQLALILKAHHIDDLLSFPLLTQPPIKALERAMLHLLRLDALDRNSSTGEITPLGRQMSTLPLPATLARILLASIEPQFDCLGQIIDIVSGLSVENIWLPIHNRAPPASSADNVLPESTLIDDDEDEPQNPIERARRTLYRRSGDHMTLLAAIQAYVSENSDRKAWCRRHGISHRAMHAAMDVRKQLTKLTAEGGRYRPNPDPKSKSHNPQPSTDKNNPPASSRPLDLEPRILRCLLTGLRANTARLAPSSATRTSSTSTPTAPTGPYTTYMTDKPLQVHPSSVLFTRAGATRPACIVFSEFVYTTRPYGRCCSEIEEAWLL